MKKSLALVWPLSIFVVVCSANPEDLSVFKSALGSLSHTVRNYSSDFNNAIQSTELQGVIDEVDKSMLGFEGTAKDRLDGVRRLNSEARLSYSNANGPVLEWCVSINGTLGTYLNNKDLPELSDNDKKEIWKIAVNGLNLGLIKISDSFEFLKKMKQHRDKLRVDLDGMKRDLNFDLGPKGIYEKRTQNLILKDRELKRQLASDIRQKFIGNKIDSRFVSEATNCLETTFTGVEQSKQEEKNKVIEPYRQLEQKIGKASELATIPDVDFEDDKTKIKALKLRISNEELKQKVILENEPDSQAELVPFMQALLNDCSKIAEKLSNLNIH